MVTYTIITGEPGERIPFAPGYTKEAADKQLKEIKEHNDKIRKLNINKKKRGESRFGKTYVNPRIIKVEDARKYYYKQTNNGKDIKIIITSFHVWMITLKNGTSLMLPKSSNNIKRWITKDLETRGESIRYLKESGHIY